MGNRTPPEADHTAETADANGLPFAPPIAKNDTVGKGVSFTCNNVSLTHTFTNIEKLSGLPEGVGIKDLIEYYQAGGLYDPSLDRIDNSSFGYSIDSEGMLSPGFSYLLVTKTVANNSGQALEVYLGDGGFMLLEDDPSDVYSYRPAILSHGTLWRSGYEGDAWDSNILTEPMESGETREFSFLFVVPDVALNNPDLAFVYYDEGAYRQKALRVGVLS